MMVIFDPNDEPIADATMGVIRRHMPLPQGEECQQLDSSLVSFMPGGSYRYHRWMPLLVTTAIFMMTMMKSVDAATTHEFGAEQSQKQQTMIRNLVHVPSSPVGEEEREEDFDPLIQQQHEESTRAEWPSSQRRRHRHQRHHVRTARVIQDEVPMEAGQATTNNNNTDEQGQETKKPIEVQDYVLWSSQEISERLQHWADHYTDFVRVTTAQDAYGFPTAGGDDDCPFDDDTGCVNYIAIIQDFMAHPDGSDSAKRLPQVLLSGCVHGDERVGPTASLEAAQLLLDAAICEAMPRLSLKPDIPTQETMATWMNELVKASECRNDLRHFGITDNDRAWLARLVSSRRIVVVPTANALGYFRNRRGENLYDPNRDFPFDITNPTDCMKTIAARTLNEVYREHMFQLAITFHGGMEVVGYEWGATSYYQNKSDSPDDVGQQSIASAYSSYGGGWNKTRPYEYGPMNDMVYPVRGGMEDWAYAGSWDTEKVIQCQPETFGGYPAERTSYDPGTLRVFNMLVETSNMKTPNPSDLGTSLNLLQQNRAGATPFETHNGHVARNIRLALLAAELVEPYVSAVQVNELHLPSALVPSVRRDTMDRDTCQTQNAVQVPYNSRKTVVRWTVGGALDVDDTQLWYAKWDDIVGDQLDCWSQPNANIQFSMTKGTPIGASSGATRFNPSKPDQGPYAASIDISSFLPNDKIVVLISARVDQTWKSQPTAGNNPQDGSSTTVQPPVPPQSHIVNARTNVNWHYETENSIIQGRVEWFSLPLTIQLSDYFNPNEDEANPSHVETIELYPRWSEDEIQVSTPAPAAAIDTTTAKSPGMKIGTSLGVLLLVVVVVAIGQKIIRNRLRSSRRNRVKEFIADESAMSPGLYHKDATNHTASVGENGFSDELGNGSLEMRPYSDKELT